ncbi:LytR C-terminal domain-containing protein [Nesterenkonia sp.]|uniref:LytR C-terminal domain-containing protein n=1 Tax=Nesterenkonia sp. TaxID=704201 RepID=UPI00260AC381|nr:LytR C-terminal domain-containing protein [Nesterenkonia sp.]
MTQFPHDEFDDVPPYKSDEVGKHRAPGAAAASGGTGSGLKWIGLLVAVVLVIGAVAWVLSQTGGDETPAAEQNGPEQTAEGDGGESPEAEAEADGAREADGEEAAGEEGAEEPAEDVNMDYSLIVYNFDGTPGVAGEVRQTLTDAGYNVVSQDNWNPGWTTCGESAPVVVHPPAEEELAQMIAEELGAATCASDGWTAHEVIAVAVGAESLQ